MSKRSEFNVLLHSFSGDRQLTLTRHSGAFDNGDVFVWDKISSVPSAEDNICNLEEEAEQRIAKCNFVRALKLFYKKIFTPEELKFLKLCSHSTLTPYKVGCKLGVNFMTTWRCIEAKYNANIDNLTRLMRSCGYYRFNIKFFPNITRYARKLESNRLSAIRMKKQMTPEQKKERALKRSLLERRYRSNMTLEQRQVKNAKRRAYYKSLSPEKKKAYSAKNIAYYRNLPPEQKAEKLAKRRELYKTLPPEKKKAINAKMRAYYRNLPPEQKAEIIAKHRLLRENMSTEEEALFLAKKREYYFKQKLAKALLNVTSEGQTPEVSKPD
jgi:hypothetical protein